MDAKQLEKNVLKRVINDLETRRAEVLETIKFKLDNSTGASEMVKEIEADLLVLDELTKIVIYYKEVLERPSVLFDCEIPF